MSITVLLDPNLYHSPCVCAVAESYSRLCVVKVRMYPTGMVAEFSIMDGEEKIVDEFLNDALTQSIEDYLTCNS